MPDIDYHRGIIFCDVSEKAPPLNVSFRSFPEDSYSLASFLKTPCSGNSGVSVVDQDRTLKFAYVARQDSGPAFGAPKPGTGFTITCHTLMLGDDGSMDWEMDYTVTSDDLPDYLQRGGIPMFPRVDIDRPHLVHFHFCEFGKAYKRMSVLSIDMSSKIVETFYLYLDPNVFSKTDKKDRLPTDDPMFIRVKSMPPLPSPFRPCELSRFCYLSRYVILLLSFYKHNSIYFDFAGSIFEYCCCPLNNSVDFDSVGSVHCCKFVSMASILRCWHFICCNVGYFSNLHNTTSRHKYMTFGHFFGLLLVHFRCWKHHLFVTGRSTSVES
jgi:hypothetical protein